FRAKSLRNLPAFAHHSLVDSTEHIWIVIHAFEPEVEQLDAKLRQFPCRFRLNLVLDFQSPIIDRRQDSNCPQAFWHIFQMFIAQRVAILVDANDLDQVMFGDSVACFASKNVFQPRLRASLISQPDEIGLGVVDSPAGKCIDMNVSLVPGWNGNGRAVPFEKSLIDPVDFLNDRKLKMQSRSCDWFSNRFAELRNDYLFRLMNREETSLQCAQKDDREDDRHEPKTSALAPSFSRGFPVSGRIGNRFRIESSIMIFSPVAESTSPMVSRYSRVRVISGALMYCSSMALNDATSPSASLTRLNR